VSVFVPRLHTHADRLERWLGRDEVEAISRSMRQWYGPPISLAGVPGAVYAARGGDFLGPIDGGAANALRDLAEDRRRTLRHRAALRQPELFASGFGSLQALIAAGQSQGNRRTYRYYKTLQAVSGNQYTSAWAKGAIPAAGTGGGAAPGGSTYASTSTGALPLQNAISGQTQHLVKWSGMNPDHAGGTLLLYDRLFSVAKTMSSTGTEAVTGVPTRYQSNTTTDDAYAGGNFVFVEVTASLANTAHNWTVCKYTNQAGTLGQSFASMTGLPLQAAGNLDHDPSGAPWYLVPATGDSGVQALTQMQCSASITGGAEFTVGHPLTFLPSKINNYWHILPMINDAFGLERIFNDACLALLLSGSVGSGVSSFTGTIETVCG
jgi:hypothetical protein